MFCSCLGKQVGQTMYLVRLKLNFGPLGSRMDRAAPCVCIVHRVRRCCLEGRPTHASHPLPRPNPRAQLPMSTSSAPTPTGCRRLSCSTRPAPSTPHWTACRCVRGACEGGSTQALAPPPSGSSSHRDDGRLHASVLRTPTCTAARGRPPAAHLGIQREPALGPGRLLGHRAQVGDASMYDWHRIT